MKEKKVLFIISFILIGRILVSIFISDILYPNTNNLIEAMLIDLSPYLLLIGGYLIYFFIIEKYERIVSKYSKGSIAPVLIIPIILIFIIIILCNKDLIISSYDDDLAMSMPVYLPSLVLSLDDAFNWLNGKNFLGYNAKTFMTTLCMLIAAIIMVSCLIYLFYLMYKIVNSKKKLDGYKEKVFIIICTYFLVTINIATVNLYLLYFDKTSFSDFVLSTNAIEAVLDSFYFTIKNFIAIGGNEANSAIAKIIVICTTCINIYYFIIFIPMILSKKEMSIISTLDNGQMITTCKFNDDKSERYVLNKVWNECNKGALFIGINPSYANGVKGDNTTTNVINFLADKDFGSLSVLNLFSIVNVKTNLNKDVYATNFNDYLYILEEVDLIIIGWGYDKKKYKKQKQEAEKILKLYSGKVFTFVDKNKQCIHPRKITDTMTLEKYEFVYLMEEK